MNRALLKDREVVEVLDLLAWAKAYGSADRSIAEDHIGEVRISTVFLGLDHSFGHGQPLWFETMIFGGPHDEYQERYTTIEEAEAGHARAVAKVKGE